MPATNNSYSESVRALSQQIVEAQTPIRVLQSIKWDESVKHAFFASGCREQPAVDRDSYAALAFDPASLRERFRAIEADISARLGNLSAAGSLMRFMCEQYRLTIEMLEARGTPAFATLSRLLYGGADDVFHVGGPTVNDLAHSIRAALEVMSVNASSEMDEPRIAGVDAVRMLQQRLDNSMGSGRVEVRLDDGILADAAAGSSYIKVNQNRTFSERDLAILEAHEGWVHVGTTLAGLAQPTCTFLGKAAPRTTVTQEGLAVLIELLNVRSHPVRLARIMHRIESIKMASEGATFRDVFESVRDEGMDDDTAYSHTTRIFRGSGPTFGPFTKDIGYGKGFALTYVYVRLAIRRGRQDRLPLLFCGKVDLLDLGVLHQLYEEGLVEKPTFVPPPFNDLPALASTMSMSMFVTKLDLDQMESDYGRLI